jgi:hypothetical protein
MDAIKATEICEVSCVKNVNPMLKKGWAVLGIFLRASVIVYVLGKNVRNCDKKVYVSKIREKARYC